MTTTKGTTSLSLSADGVQIQWSFAVGDNPPQDNSNLGPEGHDGSYTRMMFGILSHINDILYVQFRA
jgi:hypothetical protein